MKSRLLLFLILLSFIPSVLKSQNDDSTQVYLITCAPGVQTYSIYGHSALRVIMPYKGSDMVYNWGVFDFATPNFAWRFAKGRLNYMLAARPFDSFLQDYFYEQRSVYQQKINLEPFEIRILLSLLEENLKPENLNYRYDFFYDDCSTRIRDIIEKSTGFKFIYPPEQNKDLQTFRQKVGEYQRPYPWLEFGIDLIMGTPGDKKASFRDQMFLPIDLQNNMSEIVINRSGKIVPLLQNPVTVLDFPAPEVKSNFITSPIFIFSLLLIIVILLSAQKNNRIISRVMDMCIYSVYALLAIMIFFFNFFTDHLQMKWNLNIMLLSPFVIFAFISLILNKEWVIWYRLTFIFSLLYIAILLIFPEGFNNAFLPLALIIAVRSSARSLFSWNPLTISTI